jgi:hypothetical protein
MLKLAAKIFGVAFYASATTLAVISTVIAPNILLKLALIGLTVVIVHDFIDFFRY